MYCYLCLIFFLYLDLYVLGDDASVSKGSFMRTKHLCVLILIRIKSEVVAVKHVLALQLIILLTVQGVSSFVDPFCNSCFTFVFIILSSLVITCWGRALAFLCMMFPCVFLTVPYGVLGKV